MTDKKMILVSGDNRYKLDALEVPGYGYRDFINASCRADAQLFELVGNAHCMPCAQYETYNNAGGWFRLVRYPEGWYLLDWGHRVNNVMPRSQLILTPRQDEIAVILHRKKYIVEVPNHA